MIDFEEWCEEEIGSSASKFEMLQMSKKDLQEHKREAARKAWNAALSEVEDGLEIHDTMGDIKWDVEYLKAE